MEKITLKTQELVRDYNLPKWFLGKPEGNQYALDIISFIEDVFIDRSSANILELGYGIGQNLVELHRRGFTHLHGIEKDLHAFLASLEMFREFEMEPKVVCGDAQDVCFYDYFDVIMPLNFTYRADVDALALLAKLQERLFPGGYLIVDIINSSLPENKSPKYVHRYSIDDMDRFSKQWGLELVSVWDKYDPRSIYVFRRSK